MNNKQNIKVNKLELLQKDFAFLREQSTGTQIIINKLKTDEEKKDYLEDWYDFSKEGDVAYPSQGLLTTPYDDLTYHSPQMIPQESIIETLRVRRFFLELFNHPYRLHFLEEVNRRKFIPPPKVRILPIEHAIQRGLLLSIGDFGASVIGTKNVRVSRTERYAKGPFIKIGKQARSIFMGSSSPDVWNSAASISTMAACHCLAGIPRNGVMNKIKRQVELAKEVFAWLDKTSEQVLNNRSDKEWIEESWKKNVMGTLEASVDSAKIRAEALFEAGVRTFRVYSPEPGTGVVDTIHYLRKKYKRDVELIASFIIDLSQAQEAEEAGADAIIIGVGGGGRCITGVRSGSAIDWPQLLYLLRGEINIPVIVEGGASDHIALTLLLGASGISVSRIASGGTIESPGGVLFYTDNKGKLFKPYGGEASARTKFLDGKLLPFDIPSFVEGETGRAYLNYGQHNFPTITYNLHALTEDAILSMVFRGVKNIEELHALNPSPIGRITPEGNHQQQTH